MSAVSWLYLLCGTAGRLLAAGLRRMFRSQKLAGQEAPSDLPARRPRVLVVMPFSIVPPHHGGAVRLFNLIRLLSRDGDVYLLVFILGDDDPAQRQALEPWVKKLWLHPWHPDPKRSSSKLMPPGARLFLDDRAALLIRDIVETHNIEAVQLEYTELAQYRHAVGERPVILVEHDVSFRSFARRRRLGLPQRYPESKVFGATFGDWMRLMRYELRACRDVAQLHMMSSADAAYLARFLPDSTRRMRVVPNGVDTAFYHPPEPAPERRGVLFVGNFHTLPNLDAFEYLMQEVWPAIRRLRPDAELTVAGADMLPELHDWHGRDGVSVVGTLPELRHAYHRHQVLVVPLRTGSGTRLKLLEAFAAGIPAVSTTLGAEGIEAVASEHLLIADDAASLARAVDHLLGDPALAASLAEKAMRLAVEKYDWSRSARVLLDGIRQLLPATPAPRVEARPLTRASPRVFGRSPAGDIAISVIVLSYRGGPMLGRCLEALARQECQRPFEVLAIDSGSSEDELSTLREHGARVYGIEQRFFNHGLTRDLAAELAAGEVLVYLSQDAVPADERWLENLTAPLWVAQPPAAVQGAMADFPDASSGVRPFFWNTCGPRFYFTREGMRWVARHPGPSFSTVNAALRRDVWRQLPFGWAPLMEDKKWQRSALEGGLQIVEAPDAKVFHSHDYNLRSLLRRCASEGFAWRLLGERYTLGDVLKDFWAPRRWRNLAGGLWRRRGRMTMAELLFPWLRPATVWYGNHYLQEVKH